MKSIISKIFSIWALAFSILSLIIVCPIYFIIFIFEIKGIRFAHGLSRIWAKYLMIIWFSPVEVLNKLSINELGQHFIIVSNHQSQIDIPVAALSTSLPFKFLAKKELTKIPLLGYIISRLYITVDRSSTTGKYQSYLQMKECLAEGTSVWLFPEGTRNKSQNPLGHINDGAFKLSVDTKTPMLFCNIRGTRQILLPGEIFGFLPHKVTVEWFGPYQSDDFNELKDKFINIF